MANVYARESSLNNVSGRSDYISNPSRQEDIVLHKKNMENSWQDYALFEKSNKKSASENIQARETVVALPNDLAKNEDELVRFCDRLAKKLYGDNRDYEYAVHWNSTRTNLHAHFIYSERERNFDKQPKIYKRDIWADPKTGRTCKKGTPNAVLRCKKGEIQRDKEGNIKYDEQPFTVKNKKFSRKSWLDERNQIIKEVFAEFNREISLFDSKKQLPQKKLTKGSSEAYKEYAEGYNQLVRLYNQDAEVVEKAQPLVDHVQILDRTYSENQEEISKIKSENAGKSRVKRLFTFDSGKISQLENRCKQVVAQIEETSDKLKQVLKGFVDEAKLESADPRAKANLLVQSFESIKERVLDLREYLRTHSSFKKAKAADAARVNRNAAPVVEIDASEPISRGDHKKKSENLIQRDSGMSR